MNPSKERAEAAGEEKVHKEKAALVLDKREFQLGAGNGRAPGILADFVPGKGSQFGAAEQTDRRAEEDSAGSDEDKEQGAGVSDWGTPKLHAGNGSASLQKRNSICSY